MITNLNTFNDEELSYINYSVSASLKELMLKMDKWTMDDRTMYITLSTLKAKVEAIQQVMRSVNMQKINAQVPVIPEIKQNEGFKTFEPVQNVYVPEVTEEPKIPINVPTNNPINTPSYDDAVSDTGIKEKITIKKVGNK